MEQKKCPICNHQNTNIQQDNLRYYVNCSSCGKFSLSHIILKNISSNLELEYDPCHFTLKVILNKIWQSNRISNEFYRIDELYKDITQNYYSARDDYDQRWIDQQFAKKYILEVSQQVNNLILFIGDTNDTGSDCQIDPSILDVVDSNNAKISRGEIISYKIGSFDYKKLKAHYSYLERKEIVSDGYLTTEGLIEYEKLNTGKLTNIAFMAMKFSKEDSDAIFNHFKNIILEKFGVELIRLDQVPKSGLIDMNLRNKIKSSRFMISDLSHQNNGAYWEAGFAEGLGKVVIYSCDKSKENDIHFDVRNLYRINYNLESLKESNEDLINVIQASIPELNNN